MWHCYNYFEYTFLMFQKYLISQWQPFMLFYIFTENYIQTILN